MENKNEKQNEHKQQVIIFYVNQMLKALGSLMSTTDEYVKRKELELIDNYAKLIKEELENGK